MEENQIYIHKGKGSIKFSIRDNKVFITELFGKELVYKQTPQLKHSSVYFFEDYVQGDRGNRYAAMGEELSYVSHSIKNEKNAATLVLREENDRVRVDTYYRLFEGANVLSVKRRLTNLTDKTLYLEHCSSFVCYGLFDYKQKNYLYKAFGSNWAEANWRKVSFVDEGIYANDWMGTGNRYVSMSSNGSQSSKEYAPYGIIEGQNKLLFWQIMSDSVWHFEAGAYEDSLYIDVGGGSYSSSGYIKALGPNQEYETVEVQLTLGNTLDEVVADMTDFRRLVREGKPKETQAIIFNEFMHLSWDAPNEERTRAVGEQVAKYGVDYYVIDADWHDEDSPTSPTHTIGNWIESKTRFPSGLMQTLNYLRAQGLKVGLWIEMQSVGVRNQTFPLPDDCFFTFKGKKTVHNSRYHLDYRNPKVIKWADETIDRVINTYKIDYIKIDYNQFSYGSDYQTESMAASLEAHSKAYISWLKKAMSRHPNVVFESCASGGQSLNALNLSVCDLMSTSDMTKHKGYSYMSANLGSMILPEQSAIWCYPLNSRVPIDTITEEDVIINMVNPMFHRIHLASKFFELPKEHCALIKEGLQYYHKLSKYRDKAYPIFPCGFSKAEEKVIVGGMRYKNKLFLSIYKFDEEEREISIDLSLYGMGEAKVGYPTSVPTKLKQNGCVISIDFGKDASARLIEYTLK